MSTRTTSLAIAMLAVLPGCALPPPPGPDDIRPQALPNMAVPTQWAVEGAAASPVAGNWLATFDDARLLALVTEAIAYNPDLRVAAARVEVASEYVNLADSTLYPQVNLLARGGGQMGGDPSGMQGAGLYADWELDLWGRVRSERSVATASYESVVADTEYARQSVAALVAKSYFLAVEASLQLSLAERMVAAADQLTALAEQRQRIGKGDAYDAALARANAETFRDTVEQFKLAREQSLRALEALIGRYPAADVEVATQFAQTPGPVPAGLPSELLERRPDVVAAERRIAAAFYGVQEAKAARLPRISLTGNVSDISSDLFVLQDRDNPVWSAGASLLLPVFNAGALQSEVRIRTAEQKQAVAEYGRIGARAFGEVEDALSAEFTAARREKVLGRVVAENENALKLSQVRFEVGSGDLRGVRQQQLAAYGSRAALVRVQAERLVQRVNLYLALGGGFEAAPAPVAQAEN
ncbi:MAG: TolC family protein [Steroidobacteraceae bacterium]|nr:TolC family protein [Steroidobacteraceae bacterium]